MRGPNNSSGAAVGIACVCGIDEGRYTRHYQRRERGA